MSLLPQGLPFCLVKAVETVLRMTKNRVVPGKEGREKGKERQIED